MPGTDFTETFAPVARASSIRLIMALAFELNLIVHQMDVVTAFLNGEVEEDDITRGTSNSVRSYRQKKRKSYVTLVAKK